jgi:ABC-type transporter Mla subunit MlaD
MNVTIDLTTLMIVLVLVALIVLIIYAIFLLRKLLVTIDHTNTVLEDVEVISKIAASRSEDLDGIIDDVSTAAANMSSAAAGSSVISTVTSIAKSAATIKGMVSDTEPELKAAMKKEKREKRTDK